MPPSVIYLSVERQNTDLDNKTGTISLDDFELVVGRYMIKGGHSAMQIAVLNHF